MLLRCKMCDCDLTAQLEKRDWSYLKTDCECEEDLLPQGACVVSRGEFFTNTEGYYIVNLKDVLNLQVHPNKQRLNGCCGLDGTDGPNKVCQNGHEVGIEKSDCSMPHAVLFDPKLVRLIEIYT